MIVYKTNDNKRVCKMSIQDQKIITLIYFGVESCGVIADALKVSLPAITQKIIKLEKEKFVVSNEVYGQKNVKRAYAMTKRGKKFVEEEIWRERLVA